MGPIPLWGIVNTVKGFLGNIPREIWYALAALAAWWVFSGYYIGVGEDRILAQLAEEQRKREKQAEEARASADVDTRERAEEEQETADTLSEVIENAEITGTNPLDGMFSVWPSD